MTTPTDRELLTEARACIADYYPAPLIRRGTSALLRDLDARLAQPDPSDEAAALRAALVAAAEALRNARGAFLSLGAVAYAQQSDADANGARSVLGLGLAEFNFTPPPDNLFAEAAALREQVATLTRERDEARAPSIMCRRSDLDVVERFAALVPPRPSLFAEPQSPETFDAKTVLIGERECEAFRRVLGERELREVRNQETERDRDALRERVAHLEAALRPFGAMADGRDGWTSGHCSVFPSLESVRAARAALAGTATLAEHDARVRAAALASEHANIARSLGVLVGCGAIDSGDEHLFADLCDQNDGHDEQRLAVLAPALVAFTREASRQARAAALEEAATVCARVEYEQESRASDRDPWDENTSEIDSGASVGAEMCKERIRALAATPAAKGCAK